MTDEDQHEQELAQQLEIARQTLDTWKANFLGVGRDRRPELENDIARLTAELQQARARRMARRSGGVARRN